MAWMKSGLIVGAAFALEQILVFSAAALRFRHMAAVQNISQFVMRVPLCSGSVH
jgi:uncharacterized protein YcsI (UPF0317 family)